LFNHYPISLFALLALPIQVQAGFFFIKTNRMGMRILIACLVISILSSCSLQSLTTTSSIGSSLVSAKSGSPKFIDDIQIDNRKVNRGKQGTKSTLPQEIESEYNTNYTSTNLPNIKGAVPSQIESRFAELLQVNSSDLVDLQLLMVVDEWYGTRYRMGGTTKNGIDCSAFVRTVFETAYALEIPRTAREQYNFAEKISATEIQTGDLLFFNTTGGVSHVGIYLQNNKFAHSSSSKGVTISDMYEPYYLQRRVGVGRIAKQDKISMSTH